METAQRLGIHHDSFRNWIKKYKSPEALAEAKISESANAEIKRTKKSYRKTRYIKKGRNVLCKPAKLKYAFIKEHSSIFKVRRMCIVMRVHHSGYYKWLEQPISNLEIANQKLLQHIKNAYKESNGIYGYRNIHKDLKASNIHVNFVK